MVNTSLQKGCLPVAQKMAIITPLMKKASLDPHDLKNYRPVSSRVIPVPTNNIPVTYGALEVLYCTANNIRVRSDALTTADDRQVTFHWL